jgi:hypothetical protein
LIAIAEEGLSSSEYPPHQGFFNSSGSVAKFAAMRSASSRESTSA